MIDQACAGIADPAEVFAVSFRISGRLGWTHPDLARFLTGAGLNSWTSPTRPRPPRPARHQGRARQAGRFTVPDPDIALSAVAGGLLGLRPASDDPERIDETAVDQLAEAILRMLGVPAREAKRIAAREPPDTDAW